MKLITIVIAIVAIVAGVAYGLWPRTSDSPPPRAQQPAAPAKPAASPFAFAPGQSPSYGNLLARVVVHEWLDPECEACRAMQPIFKRIVADYSDRVLFVVRYIPLHKNALYAAAVLEEARESGKFTEALEILFEKQPEWGSHRDPRPELIAGYLEPLGIPKAKLERSYVVQKHAAKVKRDEDDGVRAGVTGTPTFFVNGQKVPTLSEEALRAAIERSLLKK
ncbi:MAG: thioredoxin domain-containing protein [Burkholderiales bacterium]|nr:thioredoxin domain-containing protein [Burkholderiales bacterium]